MSRVNSAVEAIKSADTITFSALIDSKDALLLSNIANSLNKALYCRDCYGYNSFIDAFASKKSTKIGDSDCVIAFASRFLDNDKALYDEMALATKSGAEFIYMHPIEDDRLEDVAQFIKYEPGSEEGVVALLLELFLRDKKLPQELEEYIEELDIGFLSGESSISEEELEELLDRVKSKKKVILVVGSDIFNHEKVENIARILATIQEYSNIELSIAAPHFKAKGVSLISSLIKEPKGNIVKLESLEATLEEIADSLGVKLRELESSFSSKVLELKDVDELPSFDGVVIYCVDNLSENSLIGTKQFSMVAKVSNGDIVEFKVGSKSLKRVFSIDTSLKGTIALNPTLDMELSGFTVSSYRFCKIFINKVGSANE